MTRTAPGVATRLALLAALALLGGLGPVAAEDLRPRQTAAGIEIAVRVRGTHFISLAASWDAWSSGRRLLTDPDGDGVWTIVVRPPPGRHEYLLMYDGQAPHRGTRIDREGSRMLQSHSPLDMGLHWLVPVHVLHTGADGRLLERVDDVATLSILDTARLLFSYSGCMDEASHRRARGSIEAALALRPRDGWLMRQHFTVEARFAAESSALLLANARSDRDMAPVVRPLLESRWLSDHERMTAARAYRRWAGREAPASGSRALLRLMDRVRARQAVSELAEEFRRSPGDLRCRFRLGAALASAYHQSDPAGLAEWRRILRPALLAAPETAAAETFSALHHALVARGDARKVLPEAAAWLRTNGFVPGVVAANFSLLAPAAEVEFASELLRMLADRPALQRDYLFWVLTFSSKLRDDPEAQRLLAGHLKTERDPLIAGRLAGRLAYAQLVAHREEDFYALLTQRLALDPADLELTCIFEAFVTSLRALEREFAGLIANPWQPKLLQRLFALEKAAPDNPVVSRMLARELIAGGRAGEAAARLRRLLEKHPWQAAAALDLARLRSGEGDAAGAHAVLAACWEARPGDPLLGCALAHAIAAAGAREQLSKFLVAPFQSDETAMLAVAGAVSGLRDRFGAARARQFLDTLRPLATRERRLIRRASLRLAMETETGAELRAAVERLANRDIVADRHPDAATPAGAGLESRGPLHCAPSKPSTTPEALALELRYAAKAARAFGHLEFSESLEERAIVLAPSHRRWLLDALDADSRLLADRAATLALGEPPVAGSAAPFLIHQARAALAAGDLDTAGDALARLGSELLLPEERRGLLAGRLLRHLAAGQVVAAGAAGFASVGRDGGLALYTVFALLLPVALVLALASVRPTSTGGG